MNKKIIIVVALICLLVGFGGGYYYQGNYLNKIIPKEIVNRETTVSGVDFSVFWKVWDLLQKKYVDNDKLNAQEMVYGAIDGMVKAAGDPYTVFFRPKDSEDFAQEINGSFGGIGIEIGMRNDVITVIAPIKSTPADKAGLLAGDIIAKIGDKSTDGMKVNEAVDLIRGPKGTTVKLTILRVSATDKNKSTDKEFTIVRDIIKVPTVAWKMIDDNTAYLQLFVFNRNADGDFKKAANEISKSGAKRIILDLRNNPGGLLDSAINIASYFLEPSKLVVSEKFGDGSEDSFSSANIGTLKNYPLVILINKGSASASEILAGALKDNRGVTLVGEKSYGKGSVQEVDELPGKSSVKITIAKWYTPKGTSINENGINPDYIVVRPDTEINSDKDSQLEKARELAKSLK